MLRRTSWIPAFWLLTAFVGFNTAALYWPHYYVQLIPPLSVLAGIAATSTSSRLLLPAVTVSVCVLPVLLFVFRLTDMSRQQTENAVPYYRQYLADERVATFLRAHSRPSDSIYALDSEADLYFLANRRSIFPYLWAHPLMEIPHALARLDCLLGSRGRPKWLVIYRPPDRVDPSGRLERAVARRYRLWATVPRARVTILRSVS